MGASFIRLKNVAHHSNLRGVNELDRCGPNLPCGVAAHNERDSVNPASYLAPDPGRSVTVRPQSDATADGDYMHTRIRLRRRSGLDRLRLRLHRHRTEGR